MTSKFSLLFLFIVLAVLWQVEVEGKRGGGGFGGFRGGGGARGGGYHPTNTGGGYHPINQNNGGGFNHGTNTGGGINVNVLPATNTKTGNGLGNNLMAFGAGAAVGNALGHNHNHVYPAYPAYPVNQNQQGYPVDQGSQRINAQTLKDGEEVKTTYEPSTKAITPPPQTIPTTLTTRLATIASTTPTSTQTSTPVTTPTTATPSTTTVFSLVKSADANARPHTNKTELIERACGTMFKGGVGSGMITDKNYYYFEEVHKTANYATRVQIFPDGPPKIVGVSGRAAKGQYDSFETYGSPPVQKWHLSNEDFIIKNSILSSIGSNENASYVYDGSQTTNTTLFLHTNNGLLYPEDNLYSRDSEVHDIYWQLSERLAEMKRRPEFATAEPRLMAEYEHVKFCFEEFEQSRNVVVKSKNTINNPAYPNKLRIIMRMKN